MATPGFGYQRVLETLFTLVVPIRADSSDVVAWCGEPNRKMLTTVHIYCTKLTQY
jgi:hypothetical protein